MSERHTADELRTRAEASGVPLLLVCWFDDKGAPLHPCGKAARALEAAGVAHERLVMGQGRPFSIGTGGTRPATKALTGAERYPALVLPDGTAIVGSGEIAAWAAAR